MTTLKDLVLIAETALPGVVPLLPANAQLAAGVALTLLQAAQKAGESGNDITDAELEALFAADDAAKQADVDARQRRIDEEDSGG